MAPVSPYAYGITLKDTDTTTALASKTIKIFNSTKHREQIGLGYNWEISSTTNASGIASLNLSNMPAEWESTDTILITAEDPTNNKFTAYKTTPSKSVGFENITLTMMDCPVTPATITSRLLSYTINNESISARTIIFYERYTGNIRLKLNVPTVSSVQHTYKVGSRSFRGGMVPVPSGTGFTCELEVG